MHFRIVAAGLYGMPDPRSGNRVMAAVEFADPPPPSNNPSTNSSAHKRISATRTSPGYSESPRTSWSPAPTRSSRTNSAASTGTPPIRSPTHCPGMGPPPLLAHHHTILSGQISHTQRHSTLSDLALLDSTKATHRLVSLESGREGCATARGGSSTPRPLRVPVCRTRFTRSANSCRTDAVDARRGGEIPTRRRGNRKGARGFRA